MAKRVVALGFFDGIHLGHCALMRRVTELAESLLAQAAAITFDPHPDALTKGAAPKLLSTVADRRGLMQRECGIDEMIVLRFDEAMRTMAPEDFVKDILHTQLQAVYVVCGESFRFGHRGRGNPALLQELCSALGIGCSIISPISKNDGLISSSRIRALVQEGRIQEANALLGHPYCLTGEVIHGQSLGHTLGFPTANFAFPEGLMCPRFGVYVGLAHLESGSYSTVTNIGLRPTVGGTTVSVESWLQGFEGDLYGKTFRLDLLDFLRPEQKFDSLEQLQQQILKDKEEALAYFSK
ncbi:MAG: bifunctional riboflavin kinase/FAD synthetase [Ruminococcaceae bacterium]|nr:bifunctional riboflavin kinase/FAD synthetase [Oscillospiraceae bacterium]